jgi:plastocyanin
MRKHESMQCTKMRCLYCLTALLFSATLVACAGSTSQGNRGLFGEPAERLEQRGSADDRALKVMANGFTLSLDASQVSAGPITFFVKNIGAIPHNFAIRGSGVDQETPVIEPGEATSLTVNLRSGTYTYKCTVHFHHLLGMMGHLTVTDSQLPGRERSNPWRSS